MVYLVEGMIYTVHNMYIMFMTYTCFDVYNYIEYAITSKHIGFEMDIYIKKDEVPVLSASGTG